MPGERFEGHIRGDIKPLAGRAHQGRRRREQQKKFDRVVARQSVEGNCAAELGVNHRSNAGEVDIGDKTVFDRRGGVDHAAQRRLVRPNSFEDRREGSAIGDVALIDANLCACGFEFFNSLIRNRELPIPDGRGARSSRHHARPANARTHTRTLRCRR